ncbi:MAG: hypothetical protein PHW03_07310 [Eubacteriales bacterium]|nr:hypothetical protein [Eubacteriales bacterium]
MLITKDGISRNIDEKDFYEYKRKGYVAVQDGGTDTPPIPAKEKPISKMSTAELEAKAVELSVDISDCKNNAERIERLIAVQDGGE